ncbi:MAG: TonB-dependent receptor [Caulobacteraceae bacterium]|nr:TonB-dependent receptor [Caulobacteraceae bacterium]
MPGHRIRRNLVGSIRISQLASVAATAFFLGAAGPARAATADDLSRLSLEELANVEITSVSKQAEPLSHAAAAVFVISADDIRRSGATSVPEVLRLAPNLQVARIDAVSYAITARGFNSRETSNKLLVLVDGRSVYTGLYSGVSWDSHAVPLGEIERIEVISGPGGALYGANAVNGVINIITRRAHESQGVRGGAGIGDDEARLTARLGTRFGDTGAVRAYISAFRIDDTYTATGAEVGDHAAGVQGGFRADWGGASDRYTLQGDLYHHDVADRDANPGSDLDGGNLLGRWSHAWTDGASTTLQAYYDRNERDEPSLFSREITYDVAVQHDLAAWGRHNLSMGAGYRRVDSTYQTDPGSFVFVSPPRLQVDLANAFVHDRIALTSALDLTLALKAEDSSVSGLEWLPGARLGWTLGDRTFLWARAERAVRTPSRIDRGLVFTGFLAPSEMDAEKLWAYEIGYRGRPTERTSLTVSAYFNDYDDLRTVDLGTGGTLPVTFANSARGEVYGIEAWGSWDVTSRWRLHAGASALHKRLEPKPGSRDITGIASGGDDPDWQAQVRSQFDLTEDVEFDVAVRAVDELQSGVPAYVATDARLGWQVNDNLEISLAGYNLFDDRHVESDDAGRRREIGRSAFLRLRWRP